MFQFFSKRFAQNAQYMFWQKTSYPIEIYNPEIIRSQTVTKELQKENADLKVKLKMALELLSFREQMLVNLEESSQK